MNFVFSSFLLIFLCTLSLFIHTTHTLTGPANYSYVPSYGNITSPGNYMVRFYGLIYTRKDNNNDFSFSSWFINRKQADQLNDTALNNQERQNLQRNIDPFLHWDLKANEMVTFNVGNGSVVTTTKQTGLDGQFDEFLSFSDSSLKPNNMVVNYTAINPIDAQNLRGNATILQPTGYSIVADIDDVIRVTQIWEPLTGLRNTFVEPYQIIPEMPELLNITSRLPNAGFHYATTTPMPIAATYIRWIYTVYPFGSLDMRPVNVADPLAALQARQDQLTRLQQTFPLRKFIMIGDFSSQTLLKAYPTFARTYPNNTACIFIRNITYTYPDYKNLLVNLEKEFRGVPRQQWFVYNKPSDLFQVDFTSGNCHPPGISVNQTTMSGGYGGTGSGASSVSASLWHSMMLVISAVYILSFVLY